MTGTGSLRRLDWRFLLPSGPGGLDSPFARLVMLGAPDGLAQRARDAGVAERVEAALPDGAGADAVAVLAGAGVSLQQAAAALRPGGVLYFEVDRRRAGTFFAGLPGRVRATATRAGLDAVRLYWAKPSFSRCEMYLPLDAPGAFRWYMGTLYTAISRERWVAKQVLRLATGYRGERFAAVAPCIAVIAVMGAPAHSGAVPAVLEHPDLPQAVRSAARPIMFTDEGERVVLLPFHDEASAPGAVVKVPKLPSLNAKTAHEQAAMSAVRERVPETFRSSMPLPLGDLNWRGLSLGLESTVPGTSLLATSGDWRRPMAAKLDDLRLAAEWITAFHGAAPDLYVDWGVRGVTDWVDPPIAEYEQLLGTTPEESALFQAIRRASHALAGATLPLVWQHRDFSVWNTFREAHRLYVIDWEGVRPGLPICDLLYFAAHWAETARRVGGEAAQLRHFEALLVAPACSDPVTAAVRRQLARYMDRVGTERLGAPIDPRFLPVTLVLTWVELAAGRARRRQATGTAGADPRAGNLPARLVEVLARWRSHLFPAHG